MSRIVTSVCCAQSSGRTVGWAKPASNSATSEGIMVPTVGSAPKDKWHYDH